ncbi:MAG: hypothetical protein IM526_02975 [Microcystis sp. M38BS1]|uniref:hypothetical protein n=1 Tax=Microcystis sp. M38BS1 TaxID=2771188 RepID=UPI0031FBBCC2|nr:hypothetical protein [Microcystis sp. M38BS1]MCA6582626.1 hypothetical protein [Pseudanabaena sp. M34BS1SP1A06MG]
MEKTFSVFIGLTQNESGNFEPVNTQLLEKEIDNYFHSFSLSYVEGKYYGIREKTANLLVRTTENSLTQFAQRIKKQFHQDYIGVIELPNMEFI